MPKFHPSVAHYNRARIQPIDFYESWLAQAGYSGYEGHLVAQVFKYLCRYPFKGCAVDDLRKAQTYLAWLLDYILTKRPGNAMYKVPKKIARKEKR